MEGSDNKADSDAYSIFFKKIILEITSTSVDVLDEALNVMIKDQDMQKHLADHRIQMYLYITGLLSFAGRELSKENIISILKAVNIEPDQQMIDVMIKANPKRDLIYLYSIYLLLVIGKEITTENISSVVKALGTKPDPEAANLVLNIFDRKYNKK